jgi:glycosyltransferase involved in cell wall biosynthesis
VIRPVTSPDAHAATHTVLIDLTPLDTPTRLRGNGRYLRELALGLTAVPESMRRGLRLLALTHLDADGAYHVTDDLAAFSGSSDRPAPTASDHYRWAYARRLGLWRAVRHVGATVIHLGDPSATPLLMGLSRCRAIVTCHDVMPLEFPERHLGWRDGGRWLGVLLARRRFRWADRVVAVSDSTRSALARSTGVCGERVVRVYNGVDVDRWRRDALRDAAPVLARFGLKSGAFALAVGAADWHKNVGGTIAGVAAARASGLDVSLAWAGRLTPFHAAAVDEAARVHGVTSHVRRLGFVADEELAVLYRAALAHLLVSRSEGFGLTVVEAMASGGVVVTSRGGALPEIAGDAAIAVDPDDHRNIGAALLQLARDPTLRAELAARGRARAPSFGRDLQAKAMIDVYRVATEAPRR